MPSAPARISSRISLRRLSGPSTVPPGRPGWGTKAGFMPPHGSHGSACPPVWATIAIVMRNRGPGMMPRSTAALTPASAPQASRTVVMPRSSVVRRLRTA